MVNTRLLGPASLDEREIRAREVLKKHPDWKRLRLVVPDHHSRLICQDLSGIYGTQNLDSLAHGFCSYVFTWDLDKNMLQGNGFDCDDSYGDVCVKPDWSTLIADPFDDDLAWVFGDSEHRLSPRKFLRDSLAELETFGFVPSIGIEHECVLLQESGEPLTKHGLDYSLFSAHAALDFLGSLTSSLSNIGLEVETYRAECHPGQIEIVLAHRNALAACDDAMLLQHFVRQHAVNRKLEACYLPAPRTGWGNSAHVHISLNPLLKDSEGDMDLMQNLQHFTAGIQRYLPQIMSVVVPTRNGWVRFNSGQFVDNPLRVGIDSRIDGLRILPGDIPRVEFRLSGSDAQLHLLIGVLVRCGLEGIREQCEINPEPLDKLPDNLDQALELWQDSEETRQIIGAEMHGLISALCKAELEAHGSAVTSVDVQRERLRA